MGSLWEEPWLGRCSGKEWGARELGHEVLVPIGDFSPEVTSHWGSQISKGGLRGTVVPGSPSMLQPPSPILRPLSLS